MLLLLLTGLVVAAPTILSKTPLGSKLLGRAVPGDNWRLECPHLSLSWIGDQSLRKVSLVDSAGDALLTAEQISIDRSLIALAVTNMGRVRTSISLKR